MGLNSRNRGRGRGISVNFPTHVRNGGGMVGPLPTFRPPQPGMVGPVMRFPPQNHFDISPAVGRPSRFNFRPQRHAFGKFPGKNFRKNIGPRHNGTQMYQIDLKKPWVTEEIRHEETKFQELHELWKNIRSTENLAKCEMQKQTVQALYNKAKEEYAASHPNEVALWKDTPNIRNYFCETCDKSFKSNDDLLLHEAEHETCGREGCEFTAHPKIIAKHIKMQHETGLYKRIGKLYTEEDINKWIEERKKRYPTRKVVEEKKILEQEKLNRGEKIKEDDSKFNKSFTNRGKNQRNKNFEKRTGKTGRKKRTRKKKPISVVEMCLEEEAAVRKGVPAFSGIRTVSEPVVQEKKDFDISDEEWETERKPPNSVKPIINGSLGLLAMCYDSDIEINNKGPDTETKTELMSADEGSGPEEVSSKNPLPEQELITEKVPFKRKSSGRKDDQEQKKRNTSSDNSTVEKRSVTLLEKLLKNEIRHERNVILQCVHYVVKNNFFKT